MRKLIYNFYKFTKIAYANAVFDTPIERKEFIDSYEWLDWFNRIYDQGNLINFNFKFSKSDQ